MSNSAIQELMGEMRARLRAEFGARLKGIVLFGSQARGDAGPLSDIDVLVLLEGPIRFSADLARISDRLYPLTLENPEHPIHAMPIDFAEYAAGKCELYRRAAREGIAA